MKPGPLPRYESQMNATSEPRRRSWAPVLLAVVILVPSLGLAGCSNQTVKKVKALADRGCACQTTACADKVNADYRELASHPARGSADDRDAIQKDYNRMRMCLTKVRAKALGQKKPGGQDAGAAAQPDDAKNGADSGAPKAGAAPGPSKAGAAPAGAGNGT